MLIQRCDKLSAKKTLNGNIQKKEFHLLKRIKAGWRLYVSVN